jgi:catechol 2,3-dioxygenase-like lactoylglutathione lyase family enzyme
MATALDTRLQAKALSPTLTVNDVQKSVAFFEALGFGVTERWEEKGTLVRDSQVLHPTAHSSADRQGPHVRLHELKTFRLRRPS